MRKRIVKGSRYFTFTMKPRPNEPRKPAHAGKQAGQDAAGNTARHIPGTDARLVRH